MFTIFPDSVIYIVAPPQTTSGGPELLHQLCHTLNQLEIDAQMFYWEKNHPQMRPEDPVNPKYYKYGITYVNEIIDDSRNLMIVPETITAPLKNYFKIQKCVWWLAANNYFWFKEALPNYVKIGLYHWLRYFLRLPTQLQFKEIKELNIHHLAQCWYTKSFLEQKGITEVNYLSDYINEDFIKDCNEKKEVKKSNIILYNPKRKQLLINSLKKRDPTLQFIPIEKMSIDEIKNIMSAAKLYVDFGAHPGKDRLPREAALCGCCIITSTLGSAGFYEDVPISDEYKFDRKKENVPRILDKIHFIIDHYDEETKKFDNYRASIRSERDTFLTDVKKLFCNVEEKCGE